MTVGIQKGISQFLWETMALLSKGKCNLRAAYALTFALKVALSCLARSYLFKQI